MHWRRDWSERWSSVAGGLLLIVLAALFLAPDWPADQTLAPLDILMTTPPWSKTDLGLAAAYNALPSDKVQYIHPIKLLTARAWREGVPLWEPHLLAGYPLIGNAQAGIFYPGTLPYLFLSGADASDLVAWLHLCVAGLGMFGFLRALRLRHLAALLGGMVFMFNAVTVGWLMWDSAAGAMVWLPWVLWALETVIRSGRWLAVIPGALAIALTYLGGHLQWSLYALLIFAWYGAFRWLWPGSIARRRVASAVVLMVGFGTALAMIQILPTLEYASQGHRPPLSFEALTRGLDGSGLLTLWSPRLFGDVTRDWWGTLNYHELIVYAGVAPWLLAVVAVAAGRTARGEVWCFAGLGLFGAACAAGTEVYRALAWLPGFNSLAPARMRYLIIVSVAVLTALGADWLMRREPAQRRSTMGRVVGSALVVIVTYLILRQPWLPDTALRATFAQLTDVLQAVILMAAVGLLALIVLARRMAAVWLILLALLVGDLWGFNAPYRHTTSTAYDYPVTPGIAWLQTHAGQARIVSVRRARDWQLAPNYAAVFGLFDVGGYDSVFPRRYLDFLGAIDRAGPAAPPAIVLSASAVQSPLIDLLNVKYALMPDEDAGPSWERVYDADLRVYQRTDMLPRVWLAAQAEVIRDEAAVLQRLSAADFDPRATVVLEQTPVEALGEAGLAPIGSASIVDYANNRLAVQVSAARAGWLVLSESYYPGWIATLDGAPVNVYRADAVLRAVPVPVGEHRLEMWFMPVSFVVGAVISGLALIGLLSVAVMVWRIERRRPSTPLRFAQDAFRRVA